MFVHLGRWTYPNKCNPPINKNYISNSINQPEHTLVFLLQAVWLIPWIQDPDRPFLQTLWLDRKRP